jgi:hypothetical protein
MYPSHHPIVVIRPRIIVASCPSSPHISWLPGPHRVAGGVSFLGQATMAPGGRLRENHPVGDLSYGGDITAEAREYVRKKMGFFSLVCWLRNNQKLTTMRILPANRHFFTDCPHIKSKQIWNIFPYTLYTFMNIYTTFYALPRKNLGPYRIP